MTDVTAVTVKSVYTLCTVTCVTTVTDLSGKYIRNLKKGDKNRMKTKEFKRLKARFTKFPDKIPRVNGEITAQADGEGVRQFEIRMRH